MKFSEVENNNVEDSLLPDVEDLMSLSSLLPIRHFCDFERRRWRRMWMFVEVASLMIMTM
jgi:hypothetical protein